MQEKALVSFDGTRLVYRVGGRGTRWIVVANGYGGTFCAWEDLLARFASRYRILIWDYRGLHRSAIPADLTHLRIEHHCQDLELLCRAEGIERMVLAGWSVGVQVALEHYRSCATNIEALLLINGAHGRVLRRSSSTPALTGPLMRPGLQAMRVTAPLFRRMVQPLLQRIAALPYAGRAMHLVGFFNGDTPTLQQSMCAYLQLDYSVYLQMVLLADDHDAADLLPRIAVPTLVLAGERDAITRPRLARSIAAEIPQALYHEIPEATHYGLMEFPDRYAEYITSFLDSLPQPADTAVA